MGSVLRGRMVAAFSAAKGDSVMRWRNRQRLLVVCYHGVDDGPRAGKSWLLLPTSEFERQVAFLAEHYDVLPIDVALRRLEAGQLQRPTACITLDDGYANNFTKAFPILKRFGAPATIYLATGMIGTSRRLWTTSLELAFEGVAAERVDLSEFKLDAHGRETGMDARPWTHVVTGLLEQLQPREREARLARLYASASIERRAGDEFSMMSWDQAREMAQSGLVTFGAHTVNHEIVSRLSFEAQEDEISRSIVHVSEEFAAHPEAVSQTFAYPNGRAEDFDARAAGVLRGAGCTAALSTIEGLNGAGVDAYALRRIVVGGSVTFENFRARTSGVVELARSFIPRRD